MQSYKYAYVHAQSHYKTVYYSEGMFLNQGSKELPVGLWDNFLNDFSV